MVKKVRGINAKDFDNPMNIKIGSPFKNTIFWAPTKQYYQLKDRKKRVKPIKGVTMVQFLPSTSKKGLKFGKKDGSVWESLGFMKGFKRIK